MLGDDFVVLKGSLAKGKLVTFRGTKSTDYSPYWEWVPAAKLEERSVDRGVFVRRLPQETAEAWARECKGKAVRADSVPGLFEYKMKEAAR